MIALRVELIATDGKEQKRILWFAVTSNGVYSGFCSKDRDLHITYHFDGNVFHNWFGEKPQRARTLPPLKDLDKYYQLYSTCFTNDLKKLHDTPPYRLKRLDGIISVDTRAYPRGIGVNLYIVPRNRYELISKLVRFPPSTREAHIFFACDPWIALVLYGNVYKEKENLVLDRNSAEEDKVNINNLSSFR